MGIPVLILGESGSGKSCSLRNFKKEELCIYNVAGKPLPFKGKMNVADNVSYVIDDSQYLMAFESFARAKETGWTKNIDLATNFKNLIQFVIKNTSEDTIVYFLHHTELTSAGKIKAKTLGQMLDNQLTVEGLFSIVLLCVAESDGHYFITNSDGTTTCKSPMEMFEAKIDNDLKLVDQTIREYYELNQKEENKNEPSKEN